MQDGALLDRWLGAGSTEQESAPSASATPAPETRIPAIEAIREEHRAIAAILNAMSHIVDGIESGRLQPDFNLLASLVEYIVEMPDKLHHPKEDRIFALLRARTHELDAQLDQLEAEHRDSVPATSRLDRALVAYIQGGAPAFDGFRDAVRTYIANEWVHLNTEETHVLPAARRLFSPEEWQDINADFVRNGDPWSGQDNRYAELFKRIANLAPAPVGVGGSGQGGD
ncbi:hemerythrin domain-containing protein [Castellaniella sp.]|uniref:hemerythrin domain-containing protein n=1 Tax=Castellaniella sp. TaxID=1955812 RepID=UPI002AFE8832|nr:hemerythrin domain-containing protein [Castellaniella sp.]